MKQFILAAILGMLATQLSAQVLCDALFVSQLSYKGDVEAVSTLHYSNMPKEDLAALNDRAKKVLSVGSLAQDKGGDYTLELSSQQKCGGIQLPIQPAISLQGLKPRGVTRIIRANINEGDIFMLKAGDDADKQGKKRAWGKQ